MNKLRKILTLLALSVITCGSACSGTNPDDNGGNKPGTDPVVPPVNSDAPVAYVTTADRSELFAAETLEFGKTASMSPYIITLKPDTKYQSVEGFGPAMTGSTCYNLLRMSQTDRTALLKELFDKKEGCGISLVRVSIGSSDFGLDEYTWCDEPGIENFAPHALDKRDVFPILKEIYAINPDIKIIGSPWSAPRWMKKAVNSDGPHNRWTSGVLNPIYYQDYAQYFVKWVQAMKAEGFDIHAITVQNEPLNHGNSMSMYMSWEEQRDFVKTALGPAFEKAGITTKILAFDHNYNYDNVASQFRYPLNIFADPEASKYFAGSAWHNYGGSVTELDNIIKRAPDKEIYFTEASIGTWNYKFEDCLINDFNSIFIETLKRNGRGVTLWNLMLDDKKGPNRPGGCQTCFGAVQISTSDYKTLERMSHYYNIAHASKVVKEGAVRIATDGYTNPGLNYVAFSNPDGSIAVLGVNTSNKEIPVVFSGSDYTVRYTFPARSTSSLIWKR